MINCKKVHLFVWSFCYSTNCKIHVYLLWKYKR